VTAAKLVGALLLSAALWLALFFAATLALQRATCAGRLPAQGADALHTSDAASSAAGRAACR